MLKFLQKLKTEMFLRIQSTLQSEDEDEASVMIRAYLYFLPPSLSLCPHPLF